MDDSRAARLERLVVLLVCVPALCVMALALGGFVALCWAASAALGVIAAVLGASIITGLCLMVALTLRDAR